jgi:hypothetical protein
MKLDKSSINLLSNLLDEIHDRFFWINQILYDKNKSELVLHLGERKKGPYSRALKIKAVEKYICEDIAGTNLNSINILTVDLENNIISVECNAPANIKLYVRPEFEIILDEEGDT